MLTWILVGLLAFAGGAFYAMRKGRRRAPELGAPSGRDLLERTLADVRVHDVLQQDGRDWLVEGVIRYEEDGHAWRAARAVDGSTEAWIVINLERGPDIDVRICRKTSLEMAGYPPEVMTLDDAAYRLARRGTASCQLEGDLGDLPARTEPGHVARCRWWRYEAAGERCLIIEQWGDTYRVLAGRSVRGDDLELFAGS